MIHRQRPLFPLPLQCSLTQSLSETYLIVSLSFCRPLFPLRLMSAPPPLSLCLSLPSPHYSSVELWEGGALLPLVKCLVPPQTQHHFLVTRVKATGRQGPTFAVWMGSCVVVRTMRGGGAESEHVYNLLKG